MPNDHKDQAELAQCICHGKDRPHAPHQPCDKGCQPDWHRDDCAIYLPIPPGSRSGGEPS